jgi:hypothetical protein
VGQIPSSPEKHSMNEADKNEAYRFVLQKIEDSYKEYCETWKNLDVKAQGTAVICGVFFAGIFTMISKIQVTAPHVKFFVFFVLTILVLSMISALSAMRIRNSQCLPSAESLIQSLTEIDSTPDTEGKTRINRLIFEHIESFIDVNDELINHNIEKAGLIKTSQGFLFVAVICSVVGAIISIWRN